MGFPQRPTVPGYKLCRRDKSCLLRLGSISEYWTLDYCNGVAVVLITDTAKGFQYAMMR